jgi:hypothetical protein
MGLGLSGAPAAMYMFEHDLQYVYMNNCYDIIMYSSMQ